MQNSPEEHNTGGDLQPPGLLEGTRCNTGEECLELEMMKCQMEELKERFREKEEGYEALKEEKKKVMVCPRLQSLQHYGLFNITGWPIYLSGVSFGYNRHFPTNVFELFAQPAQT